MPPTENYLPVLLKRSPNDKPPLWLGRIRRLSLKAERFQGAENDAYSSIPETKATAPSSLTIGTDIDAAIDYSSATLLSDVRVRAAFARLQVKDEDPQESADDLRISSSLSLPGMRFHSAKKSNSCPTPKSCWIVNSHPQKRKTCGFHDNLNCRLHWTFCWTMGPTAAFTIGFTVTAGPRPRGQTVGMGGAL